MPHQDQCLGGWFPSLHFHLPTAQEVSGSRHFPDISRWSSPRLHKRSCLRQKAAMPSNSLPAADLAMACSGRKESEWNIQPSTKRPSKSKQERTKTHHYNPHINKSSKVHKRCQKKDVTQLPKHVWRTALSAKSLNAFLYSPTYCWIFFWNANGCKSSVSWASGLRSKTLACYVEVPILFLVVWAKNWTGRGYAIRVCTAGSALQGMQFLVRPASPRVPPATCAFFTGSRSLEVTGLPRINPTPQALLTAIHDTQRFQAFQYIYLPTGVPEVGRIIAGHRDRN